MPGALAGVRDAADYSPPAAVNLLLSALEQGLPPGGALYDEDALTGRCLAALGLLRPREPAVRPASWGWVAQTLKEAHAHEMATDAPAMHMKSMLEAALAQLNGSDCFTAQAQPS